ncbi:MAG: Mor transcription activator family protein [Lachnospiraceae bacterium]
MGELVDITSADLAGIYSELAETVGVENAYEIYKQFKGMQMMFPLKFYSPEYTKRILKEERESGISVRELVRKHELSESRVRQILREGKDESK